MEKNKTKLQQVGDWIEQNSHKIITAGIIVGVGSLIHSRGYKRGYRRGVDEGQAEMAKGILMQAMNDTTKDVK